MRGDNMSVNIYRLYGNLSDEWRQNQCHCSVEINSDGLRIKYNGNEFEKAYFDLNCLKIEKRTEVKKKFLFTSKTLYIKFIVNDIPIPEIIANESDYENMIKAINAYKHEIKKKQEQILQEQALKNEIIKYYDSLKSFFFIAKMDSDGLQKNIQDKIGGKSIFLYLIKDMYNRIGNTNSLNQAMSSIMNLNYFKSLLFQAVKFDPVTDDGVKIPDYLLSDLYESAFKLVSSEVDTYISDKINPSEYKDILINMTLSQIKTVNENFYTIPLYYFIVMYIIAAAFIKCLVICRNQQRFRDNEELYKMFLNLSSEVGLDAKYIAEKLYPIYLRYYKNTFNEQYSSIEFLAFITFFNNHHTNTADVVKSVYEEEINKFNNEITKKPEEYSQNEYNMLLSKVTYLNFVQTEP